MAILHFQYLPAVKAKYDRDRKTFDRAAYEAAFDKFLADQHAQPTGNLHQRLFRTRALDEPIKEQLKTAKEKRNFLAHHYFRDRSTEFMSRSGRNKMIAELKDLADYFENLDKTLGVETRKVRAQLGINEEAFRERTRRFVQEIKRD